MAKTNSSQKKVSLSDLNNHNITNKRQALKDLKMLNFDELQFKNPAQRRFYKTITDKDITFGIGPAGCGKTYLSVHKALRELGDKNSTIDSFNDLLATFELKGLGITTTFPNLGGSSFSPPTTFSVSIVGNLFFTSAL